MTRESVAYLIGGFVFGILFGFALFHAIDNPPELGPGAAVSAGMESTRGPNAPNPLGSTAGGGDGGAPMMARIGQLQRNLEQNPENMGAAVELADIYQRAAMWEPASGYYERALEIEPEHPELLVNLGLCYRGMEKYSEAIDSFERAYGLDASNWQSLFNTVVVAAVDLRQFEVAFRALEAMEAIEPRPEGLEAGHLEQLRDWLVTTQKGSAAEG